MTRLAVTACVLAFAICFPATCKGQYYWGANGWRQYWQPSSSSACDRAYPTRQTGGYVHSCRYYCSGLPVRYSFEQDGTPCLTDRRITGSCYAGRCQIGWLPVQPPVAPQAPATAASVVTTESSPLESQGWSWPSEDVNSQRCTRADQQVPTVRRSCRYICKGWPIRRENEADGTACQLSWWREGFCFRGHCQRNYPLPPVSSDEDNEIEGGKVSVRYLKCRNYKERVQVDGVVRSCKFVCKRRRRPSLRTRKMEHHVRRCRGRTGSVTTECAKQLKLPWHPVKLLRHQWSSRQSRRRLSFQLSPTVHRSLLPQPPLKKPLRQSLKKC
uniref:Putative papa 2 n=1 Tax=Amblyomma triste TaxID=251400 RepID=A0A023G287_AMBTT